MRFGFKTIGLKLAAAVTVLGVAACNSPPAPVAGGATTPVVRDTGNMAYPAPLPQGNVSTTTTARPSAASTTGNMAYPAPLPQGTVRVTP